jgi:anti-sigma-K factor RskA
MRHRLPAAEVPLASSLFDAQGCLTAEGFARIEASPPGRAPAELAAHLASCVRCQRRLLVASSPAHRSSGPRERPPLWRTAVVVAACIMLVVITLIWLRQLTTAPR